MRNFTMLKWLGLSLLVVILDQASKLAIAGSMQLYQSIPLIPSFRLTYVHNTGAAFSFLSEAGGWQRWFFLVLALLVSAWIVSMLRRYATEALMAFPLALVLGGALGNVIDRIRLGAVVDFLSFHLAGYYWPAFNVADSAITVGVAILLVDGLIVARRAE